ncbi:uncharacterized protein LOC127872120 [Dreissena polymorpha]|uniref:ATP-dependent DNA helicase n=1 Tax=Dreissena polymorpha TaxID=45954 RepID=A0A9D4QX99_DREPO|nr:uncharacterized protein LOC127872120 [Dreissena polymorpha]KAH3847066.1 hypothetical protein DPMN_089379 [Dreissena polymorpha]
MDTDQKLCCSLIKKEHYVGIFWQVGTGNTFTIKAIVEKLKKEGQNVSLNCYTGIACLNYTRLKPLTLHTFAGLEDGRHSKEKLVYRLTTDEQFEKTLMCIHSTDILIIDKVSMVSKRVFETVEYVCKKLKDPSKLFGGMQVVLCGDFGDDNGDYCFHVDFFSKCFPHIVILSQNHRQKEPMLIKAVNELAHGEPSPETNAFIESLARPLSVDDQTDITRLYARNFDADISNYRYLESIPGPLCTFEAEDSIDAFE